MEKSITQVYLFYTHRRNFCDGQRKRLSVLPFLLPILLFILIAPCQAAENKLNKAVSQDGDIKLEIWSEKEEYKIGEKIVFFASVDKECYFSMIHTSVSGEVTKLFPNGYDKSGFVKGGTVYQIPSDKMGIEFTASEPYGEEIVRGIATRNPNLDIEAALDVKIDNKGDENPFGYLLKKKKASSTNNRGISVTAKKLEKGEWSEASIKIRIVP